MALSVSNNNRINVIHKEGSSDVIVQLNDFPNIKLVTDISTAADSYKKLFTIMDFLWTKIHNNKFFFIRSINSDRKHCCVCSESPFYNGEWFVIDISKANPEVYQLSTSECKLRYSSHNISDDPNDDELKYVDIMGIDSIDLWAKLIENLSEGFILNFFKTCDKSVL